MSKSKFLTLNWIVTINMRVLIRVDTWWVMGCLGIILEFVYSNSLHSSVMHALPLTPTLQCIPVLLILSPGETTGNKIPWQSKSVINENALSFDAIIWCNNMKMYFSFNNALFLTSADTSKCEGCYVKYVSDLQEFEVVLIHSSE